MTNRVSGKKTRCRVHGGLSTGPRTLEGRDRSWARNLRHARRTKRYREARRVLRQQLRELKQGVKELRHAMLRLRTRASAADSDQ
jgi:hypothetical protein